MSATSFAIGLIAGIVLTGILVWKIMPRLMLTVRKSKLGFQETINSIEENAAKHGWAVPKIYNLQKTLQEAGHEEMTSVKIVSLCQPDHAFRVLHDDENKKISGIMPCRIGIFTKEDGEVYLSKMNVKLMSKMFGGTVAKIMSSVSDEEKWILQDVVEH